MREMHAISRDNGDPVPLSKECSSITNEKNKALVGNYKPARDGERPSYAGCYLGGWKGP